jgi:hypothetical protein
MAFADGLSNRLFRAVPDAASTRRSGSGRMRLLPLAQRYHSRQGVNQGWDRGLLADVPAALLALEPGAARADKAVPLGIALAPAAMVAVVVVVVLRRPIRVARAFKPM